MILGQIKTQVFNFVRPTGTSTTIMTTIPSDGSTVDNLTMWIDEELRRVYRSQKWFFLWNNGILSTVNTQQTYPSFLSSAVFELGDCTYLGNRLPSIPIQQGLAFFTTSGAPRGIALDPQTQQTIWIFPVPNAVYSVGASWYVAPVDLKNPGDTNFLTANFADLVISLGVWKSFNELQNQALASYWGNIYQGWLGLLREADTEFKNANGTLSALLAAQKVLGMPTAVALKAAMTGAPATAQ